jgi:hypothetical protein
MVGHIAEKRALPGAMLPARPGRGSNTAMQPLYMKPSPSVMTPGRHAERMGHRHAIAFAVDDRDLRRVARNEVVREPDHLGLAA